MNTRLLFAADAVRLNIKSLGYEYARSLRDKLIIPENLSPQKIGLKSQACQQRDIEGDYFLCWCQQLHTPVVYHGKLWECCYILQALYEHDCLTPGRKGLGFGCGEEPLPSLLAADDIAITATDLDPAESAAQGAGPFHYDQTRRSASTTGKRMGIPGVRAVWPGLQPRSDCRARSSACPAACRAALAMCGWRGQARL